MWRRSSKACGSDRPAAAQPAAPVPAGDWTLTPVPTPMRLLPGERCYVHAPTQLLQIGDDPVPAPARVSGWGVGWSGLLLFSGTARTPPRPAAPSWRLVDWGTLYLTNRRFAVQGVHRWTDLWFRDIRIAGADDDAIVLQVADLPPTRLRVSPVAEYFAVFTWLADRQPSPSVHDMPAG